MIANAALYALLQTGVAQERGTQARAVALAETRDTINRMTKEVRQATALALSSNRSTLDMTSYIDGAQTRIVYYVSAGELRRAATQQLATDPLSGPYAALVKGVVAPDIFCYDAPACLADNPQTALPALVRISIVVQPDQRNVAPLSLALDVHLRNANLQ